VLEEKAANPLRRYLGLSDSEQKRIRRRDVLIDRDLYSDLRRFGVTMVVLPCVCRRRPPDDVCGWLADRYGFEYLVLPIMQQGGFRTFAQMVSEGRDQPPRQAEVGGLALGQ
jgi:hypothetical protein